MERTSRIAGLWAEVAADVGAFSAGVLAEAPPGAAAADEDLVDAPAVASL